MYIEFTSCKVQIKFKLINVVGFYGFWNTGKIITEYLHDNYKFI